MKKEHFTVSKELWEDLAPFSIVFDSAGSVRFLSRRMIEVWQLKGDAEASFEQVTGELMLTRPFERSFHNELLPHLTNMIVHLELSSLRGLVIRGQLYRFGEEWLFSGFPMVSSVSELENMGFMLSDLPLNTGLGERLLSNEANVVSLKDSKDTAAKLAVANHYQKQTLERFAKFVPERFLETLGIDSPLDAELGSHVESHMVIMFADLRGFTTISQSLSAAEIFGVINQYLQCTVPCIEANGGFVIHYLGDGIMALFPSGDASALRAAVEMQKALRMCQGEHSTNDFYLNMSIGIHEGPVALGIVGDENRWDASIISDAVNTSARIEAKTRALGGEILVSREFIDTLQQGKEFQTRSLGLHEIRGRSGMTELIEVMDSLEESVLMGRKQTLSDFNYGVAAYRDNDMYLAMSCFSRVLSREPEDKAAQLFLARIAKKLASDRL